ncbi:MAG: GIY-YIG nuclease family protein [Oscillospiraceae bacterium]|nr:GIY-YIG nuclease family protein [Oscillospiraceae bacterium]
MTNKILLCEILNFKCLRERYPDKRIKLRYNKDFGTYSFAKEYENEGLKGEGFYEQLYATYDNSGDRRFLDNDIVFQFIEIKPKSWLLVEVGIIVDFAGCKKDDWFYAKANSLAEYESYLGRVIVDKQNDRNSFYVEPAITDKVAVTEVLSKTYLESAETFSGYDNVSKSYGVLKRILNTSEWWNPLREIYGVYVITDRATGKQYVGSAYGDDGVAGRWTVYLEKGYDKFRNETGEYPNKKLRELVEKKGIGYVQEYFQYTLLEIFPKTEPGKRKALEREIHWKKALQTKGEFGYNAN